MKDRVQVQQSSTLARAEVVDEHRCADPGGATVLYERLKRLELGAAIDQVIDSEHSIR
jgi:hypothetical protein